MCVECQLLFTVRLRKEINGNFNRQPTNKIIKNSWPNDIYNTTVLREVVISQKLLLMRFAAKYGFVFILVCFPGTLASENSQDEMGE